LHVLFPIMNKSLPIILASFCIAAPLQAQSVTWGAIGLPPGVSISSVNGNTALISGVPTTPGNYNAIVFPKIGNAVGDMQKIPITVLPPKSDLPIYYGYQRLAESGEWLNAFAGGSGYILAISNNKAFFTTDGVNFKQASLPSAPLTTNISNAAIAGPKCIVFGVSEGSEGNTPFLAYSDNRTAFKSLNFPTGTFGPLGSYGRIVSNGTNRFFYLESDGADLTIWSLSPNQMTWSYQDRLPVHNTASLGNNGSLVPIAGKIDASMASNGSLVLFALSSYDVPVNLFYSTNGGDFWSESRSNPGISSVAYGNNVFLGSGPDGLWKSTNGVDWQKISSTNYHKLVFSTNEKLFFSSIGVSKTGTEWIPYDGVDGMDWQPVTTNTGVVMIGNSQLTLTTIPSYWEKSQFNTRKAIVGKPFSFNISVKP